MWQKIYHEKIGATEFATSENIPFRANIEATEFGPVTYAKSEGALCRLERGTAADHKSTTGCYTLIINLGLVRWPLYSRIDGKLR